MKKSIFIFLFGAISLPSCNQEKLCTYGEVDIPCEQQEALNKFLSYEAAINATFSDHAPAITSEEELKLRENIVSFYDSNKVNILEANKIAQIPFGPEHTYKNRVGEITYFKKQIEKEIFMKDFSKKLEITETIKDNKLLWSIKNNSDSTISSFRVNKNYEKEGRLVKSKTFTTFLLTHDQIVPELSEEEGSVVKPGSTVELSFYTSDKKIAKPELLSVSFYSK